MRMWMVNTRILCRQHLLGEHNEIHKHKPSFEKHHSIVKRIELKQIEPKSMQQRHDNLANEMLRRGYNHNSPYMSPDISYLPLNQREFEININDSLQELLSRCDECKKNFILLNKK